MHSTCVHRTVPRVHPKENQRLSGNFYRAASSPVHRVLAQLPVGWHEVSYYVCRVCTITWCIQDPPFFFSPSERHRYRMRNRGFLALEFRVSFDICSSLFWSGLRRHSEATKVSFAILMGLASDYRS